jgi:hypothetical protein
LSIYLSVDPIFQSLWLLSRFPMTNHRVCNNLRVTRRVSLVEQILLTPRSTWVHPRFLCAVHVAQSLVFCVVFCRSLFIRFCWSWRCLSISNLLLLSAHFISSSFSSCGNINFHFGVLPCHLHRLLLVTFAYRIYLKNCSLDVRQQSINHLLCRATHQWINIRVSDCCFTPSDNFLQLYNGKNKLQWDDEEDHVRLLPN